MNKKKVIALLLAFAMMIPVFLTACNKDSEKKPDDSSSTTQTDNTGDTADKDGEETPDGEETDEVDPSQMKISKLDELNVASATQVATYDYVLSSKTSDHEINANLVDGLLETDTNGKLKPCLAESYESNEDKTVWTFKIRQGVNWVDSDENEEGALTAEDFVTGVRHGAEFKSETSWLLEDIIKGYSDYLKSDFSDEEWEKVGVKALSEDTLEFTLEKPTPFFPSMTTYTVLYPISRDFLEGKGTGCALGSPDPENCSFGALQNDAILYNGGYIMEENTAKSRIAMKANPYYWDKDNVFLKKVTYIYDDGSDPYSVIKGFESGLYPQAALSATWEDYDKYLEKYKDYAYFNLPNAYAFGIVFNFNRQTFDETNYASDEAARENTHKAILNENFRKALRAAYDAKAALAVTAPDALAAETLRNVNNFPEAGNLSDGTTYYENVSKQYEEMTGEKVDLNDGQDPWLSKEKALEFIAKAEEEGIKFPVKLDMLVLQTSDSLVKKGQSMKKSIEENTDGKIIIELVMRDKDTVESIAYRNGDPAKADYDISTFTGWGPDYADPKSFVDIYSVTTGNYMINCGLGTVDEDGNIEDQDIKEQIGMMEYEKYYREADKETTDMDKRYTLFAKADACLINHAFYIPTSQQTRGQVVSHYVPFSQLYSPWGASQLKFKSLQLQENIVTAEERQAAYEKFEEAKKAN